MFHLYPFHNLPKRFAGESFHPAGKCCRARAAPEASSSSAEKLVTIDKLLSIAPGVGTYLEVADEVLVLDALDDLLPLPPCSGPSCRGSLQGRLPSPYS